MKTSKITIETKRNVKKYWITMTLACIATMFLACDNQKRFVEKVPIVTVEPSHIDLGGIPEGQSKWAKFVVTNSSSEQIKIAKLKSSCGCTSAQIDTDVIAPGESAHLKAEMSNHGRFGKFTAQVSAEWTSESSATGQFHVTTEATAEQLAIVNPMNVDFGKIAEETKDSLVEVTVSRGNTLKTWSTFEIHSDSPHLKSIGSKIEPNGLAKVSVHLDPVGLPQGRFRDGLLIRFFDETGHVMEERSLSAQALIDGPFKVTPTSLYFGVVNSNATIDGQVSLRSRDGTPAKIAEINTSTRTRAFQFGDVKCISGETILPFTFKAPEEAGNASATIQVTLQSEKGKRVIEIPVICFVKGKMPYTKRSK